MQTPYGTLMNFAKLRLYVSAGLPYGKPVYFEAAVERYKDMGVLEGGFMNAMLAGSNNLGITNCEYSANIYTIIKGAVMRDGVDWLCWASRTVSALILQFWCAGHQLLLELQTP